MKQLLLLISLTALLQPAAAQLHFTDRAESAGIDHSYLSALLGGGVSFYDFNQDGWDDITLATAEGDPVQFYQNMGGHFQLLPSLVDNEGEVKQLLWVDFDNDGDPDLFLATYYGLNRLYKNTGNLQFTDITLAAGLPTFNTQTFGACFGDYDRDGWVDLYFNVRVQGAGDVHYLFRNNGDGTFTDVTAPSQSEDAGGRPFCSGFLDYNQDQWPDIYTAHDRMGNTNTLLENQGDGTFVDRGPEAGADIAIDAMSVTTGDYNRDGLIDIYCTNIDSGNNLLLNQGDDGSGQYTFAEVAAASGVGFFNNCWGAVFLDADNDADLDLYVSGSSPGADVASAALYLNEDDGTFSEPDLGFVGDTVRSYNNAIGDYNLDGYPDIMVVNIFPHAAQLWSSAPLEKQWLKVSLEGVVSNRDAIGSLIECYRGDHYQQRYTRCGNGFLGQNSGTEIIGLDTAAVLDSLVITWPSGHLDRYYNLPAGEHYAFTEGGSTDGDILPDPATGLEPLIVTSVAEVPQAEWQLYPSPAKRMLFLQTKGYPSETFRIFDTQGRQVLQGQTNGTDLTAIDVHRLPSGIYYLLLGTAPAPQRVKAWYKD